MIPKCDKYKFVIDTLSTLAPPPPPPAPQVSPQATQVGFFENPDNIDLSQAVSLARDSDVSIIFTGNNKEWESESFDRLSLFLSPEQDEMVKRLASASKKTVVVNQTGSAFSMPWIDSVDAVLQEWLAGMEAGNALADVISGQQSPSGRLPTTFPVRIQDLPAHKNFPADADLNIAYEEGLEVGYRAFAKTDAPTPLFPFGHGLSYATFEYSSFSVAKCLPANVSSSPICVASVQVKNTSKVDGKEVVQLYVNGALKAFTKVMIFRGQEQTVTLELDRYAFSSWNNEAKHWEVSAGTYTVDMRRSSLETILATEVDLDEALTGSWTGI